MSDIKKEMKEYDDKLNFLANEIEEMVDGMQPAKHIADMCMDAAAMWNRKENKKLTDRVAELEASLLAIQDKATDDDSECLAHSICCMADEALKGES